MPYIEVWVDDENLTDDQWKAIRRLVSSAREVAADYWPDDHARELEAAAVEVIRTVLLDDTSEQQCSADRKYRKWLEKRRSQVAQAEESA